MRTNKIVLYDEPLVPEINISELKKFLVETVSIQVEIRDSFFKSKNKEFFENMVKTCVNDLKKPFQQNILSKGDVLAEMKNEDAVGDYLKLYDGIEFQRLISEHIPENEHRLDTLHVIFTNRLTCTFDERDYRYHARAIINANPAVISTTGMIEAPAKPKRYYLDMMTAISQADKEQIKNKFKGEFLEYHDSRLNEISKGYLLQAVMYNETGEAFCENKECRLFNAHWQKDLFYLQLEKRQICEKHREIILKLKNRVTETMSL